jgi:hypothetical protein
MVVEQNRSRVMVTGDGGNGGGKAREMESKEIAGGIQILSRQSCLQNQQEMRKRNQSQKWLSVINNK